MSTTIPLFRASVYFILILFTISSASPREHAGILSRLYKQASKQHRPLIIVLDNSVHGKTDDVKYKTNLDGDKMMSQPLYIYDLDQNSKPAKLLISTLLENKHYKEEKRPIKKRAKQQYELKNVEDKRFLRSPVIKSLLRISNSLRCDAKNDCEDECNDKYNGGTQEDCEEECEIKYSCEESVEVKDEALEMSTKGERLVTETPK